MGITSRLVVQLLVVKIDGGEVTHSLKLSSDLNSILPSVTIIILTQKTVFKWMPPLIGLVAMNPKAENSCAVRQAPSKI